MKSAFPLLTLARWLLLAGIVAAPWPFAGVPQWTQPWFAGWLLGVTALWAVGRIAGRGEALAEAGCPPAKVPRLLVWCSGLLVIQGWLLIANAQTQFDWATFSFLPAHPWWAHPWAPGALDTAEATPAMWRLTGLLGALLMMTEMAQSPRWRQRLFYTLLGGGMAVALCGLLQRGLHTSLGLWSEGERDHTYFAAFYYHGNAGAFLNLLVPGVALLTARRPGFWSVAALLLVLTAAAATASKAAMVLTLVLLGLTLIPALKGKSRWLLLLVPLLCLLPLANGRVRARWAELPALLQWHNPRLLAWRAELRMLPDAGPWGIGPANFKFAFPHYTAGLDPAIAGFWEYAHQDYLQTAIEWGWCGFPLWALLIAGALRRGTGLTHRAALLAIIGVLLHALGDYPLQIPAVQLYAAGWLGILWSDRRLSLPPCGVEPVAHLQDRDDDQPVSPA